MADNGFRKIRASFMEHPQRLITKSTVSITDATVAILGFDYTDYHVTSVRIPSETGGQIATFIEFVDPEGQGHQIALPTQVVQIIVKHRDALNLRNKKSAAKAAMERRIASGQAPAFLKVK